MFTYQHFKLFTSKKKKKQIDKTNRKKEKHLKTVYRICTKEREQHTFTYYQINKYTYLRIHALIRLLINTFTFNNIDAFTYNKV